MGDVLVLAGIIVIMLTMSPRLAAYTFLVLPLMIVATYLFSSRAKDAFRQTRSSVAKVVGSLAESIDGIRVIQAFNQESAVDERFEEVNDENRASHVAAMRLSFVFLPSIEFLGGGCYLCCHLLWWSGCGW